MFCTIRAARAQKYPSGLTSGKPNFSFRGHSRAAGFFQVCFIAKLVDLNQQGKVIPSSAAKHPKKERKASPIFP